MHEQFLLAALDQAWFGRGQCAPNPSVGAVAVHNGKIIAQTWHHGAGTPHAEQLLLDKLPKNIPEITLSVTLEPCNHWGKTPPCVNAIVNYGVKKVVYAYRDLNPTVIANNTPRLLSEQGIEVLHYPLPEIDDFYQSYRYWTITKKPWVTVKIAQSMDGKIAKAQNERVLLSNASCSQFTHQQRLHCDVILTTAKTVNQDDPRLNARISTVDIAKPVAILDSQATLNSKAKLFATASQCHIYFDDHRPQPVERANHLYHAVPAIHGLLDLEAVIHHLGQQGYHDVWVEAGGTLFTALHLAGLVNRTYIYIVPTVLGDTAVTAYHHAEMFKKACKVTWKAMGDNMIASLAWAADPI